MTRLVVPIHRCITSGSIVELTSGLCLNIRDIGSVMEEDVFPIKCPRFPRLVTHNVMCGEKSKIEVGV